MIGAENSLEELLTERKCSVDNYFKNRFPHKIIKNELFFQAPDGMVFTVNTFPYFKSIFMEWAESFERAVGGREDGDLYSINLSETDMLHAMLKEIEG